MLRVSTVSALVPHIASRKTPISRGKRHARTVPSASPAPRAPFQSLSMPLFRFYSTPVTTGTAAATGAATSAASTISNTTAAAATTSATTAAATAGTGFWSNLFFMTKYKAMGTGLVPALWFPVYGLASLMEAAQIATGMPWWSVIASTAVILRLFLSPVVITQMKTAAVMERIQPKMQQIREEMMTELARAKQAGENASALAHAGAAQNRISELMREEGIGPMTAIKNMFIQMIPMALFFITLNQMSSPEMGFDALKTGGMLWFTDLSVADPYLIFPMSAIASMFITIALNPSPKPMSTTMKTVFGVLAVVSFWITSSFPAAVHIYWTAVNLMTILTMLLLRIPSVRKRLNIPLRLADSVKSEHNKLFDKPPAKVSIMTAAAAAAAAAAQQAQQPAAPRPTGKRQQRQQQQTKQDN